MLSTVASRPSALRRAAWAAAVLIGSMTASPLFASFGGTDIVIPASARAAGVSPAQFYSTLWVTNPGAVPANVTLQYLRRDVSNTAPSSVAVTVAAGETKKYENFVEGLFGLSSASGAVRILADQEVVASSRTYNLPTGSTLRDANGLFFGAIPASFAIGNGETAQLQGVSQNGSEDFRYNFGLVEIGGAAATVRVNVRESNGTLLGTKDYPLQAFEPKQYAITDAAPGLASSNARIEATVVAGTGKVLVYGTGIANGSQDSIGFEMSFKTSLLSAGVSSLNGLTGAVTLAAGANVTITPLGNTLTIAASGAGGGGLTLPFTGSASTTGGNAAFAVGNTGAGVGILATASDKAISGAATSTGGNVFAIQGVITSSSPGGFSAGLRGINNGTSGSGIGVWGSQAGSGWGVYGTAESGGRGVYGVADGGGSGVYGANGGTGTGVYGYNTATGAGVYGRRGAVSGLTDANTGGVWGDSRDFIGVVGLSSGSVGVAGASSTRYGVQGVSYGTSGANSSAVIGFAQGSGSPAGYFSGNVQVTGSVSKASGSFKIDHPLDPENKYLYHSFVESPDMLNVYNGNAVLGANGEAVVVLPEWFEALNGEYRYQLTCIGGFAPVYVADEISENRFRIAGGKAGLKVSWQVTGVRKDAWAKAHRIPVEEAKPDEERGYYLHPEEQGQPEEKGILWARDREGMARMKQTREAVRAAKRPPASED